MAPTVTPRKPRRRPGPKTPLPLGDWKARYVERLREHAGYYLAAEDCGVHYRTVLRERDRDPDFDRACTDAREAVADTVEFALVRQARDGNNAIAAMMWLKSISPATFIERHQVTTLATSVTLTLQPSADDARQLLTLLAGLVTSHTADALVGRLRPLVLDAQKGEPVSEPEPSPAPSLSPAEASGAEP